MNSTERPNPWAGAVITKLTPISSSRPLAFFDARFPLLELTLAGCTLWRTRAGKLWCSAPKQKRAMPDGTSQYDDVIAWDSGRPASLFSAACLEAIQHHSPMLLAPLIEGHGEPTPLIEGHGEPTPLIEGHGEPTPLALPQQRRDRPIAEPASAPAWWERSR